MRKTLIASAALVFAAAAYLATPSHSAGAKETVQVDGVHSAVIFKVKYFKASSFYGSFRNVSGTIVTTENGVGSADLTIRADSVFTANAGRDKHLRSGDFFSAKEFPEITFKSDNVKHLGGDKYEAAGKFTLHGVTKDLTIAFVRTGRGKGRQGEPRTGFEGTFTFKRSAFGMKYMVGPLSDDVTITAALAAIIQ